MRQEFSRKTKAMRFTFAGGRCETCHIKLTKTPHEERAVMPWAIKWRSKNALDGKREYLVGTTQHPCRKLLFEKREDARDFINREYGYIRNRADLRREPHRWRMPQAVRVIVEVREP